MNVVMSTMTLQDFFEECNTFGWRDGRLYPANMATAHADVATRLGISSRVISSSHNEYRYEYNDNDLPADNDERWQEVVWLRWEILGTLYSKAGDEE